jgi:hypothetical protein
MRMWMCDPGLLCHQHLLGEHNELHMIVGSADKQMWPSLAGLAKAGFIEPLRVLDRHEELVKEMELRGFNHVSSLHQPMYNSNIVPVYTKVDKNESIRELYRRCAGCRSRIRELIKEAEQGSKK